MADDYDDDPGEDPEVGQEPDDDDDGPSREELEAAALPDEEEGEQQGEQQPDQPTIAELEAKAQAAKLTKALRRQRDDNRAVRRQMTEQRQVEQVRQERWEKLITRMAEQTGADVSDIIGGPPAPPDPDRDPASHIVHQVDQKLQPLLQKLEVMEARERERAIGDEMTKVDSFHERDIEGFRSSEAPDYDQAEEYLIGVIEAETMRAVVTQNPDLDDDEVAERVQFGLQKVAADLQVQYAYCGRSLAREIWRKAIESGYVPQHLRNGQPQRQAPGKRPAGKRTESLRQNIRNGAVAGAAGRGGTPRSPGITLEKLLDSGQISDDEFDEMTEKPGMWKRLLEQVG